MPLFRRPVPYRRPAAFTTWLTTCVLGLCLLSAALVTQAANDRGLIYRAQRGTSEIVLLGSIHLGNAAMYPLRPAILAAYQQADALVVELDVNQVSPERMAAWMSEHGRYPAGDSLRNHVTAKTWDRLTAHLQKVGLQPELFQQYVPGILINMLTMTQLMQSGLSTTLGLDQHFLAAAYTDKKPIIELETAEEQLAILASMPNADALINDTLDELQNLPAASDTLFNAWKLGESRTLENEVNKSFDRDDAATREFFDKIFTRRNIAMTERIDAISNTHSQLFVVVGAGHLLGAEGIVALLEQRGFTTEQL